MDNAEDAVDPLTHKLSEVAEMMIEEAGLGNNISTGGDRISVMPTGIHLNEAEVSS